MRWEWSEGAGSTVVRALDQPGSAWEESDGRAETGRQVVWYFETGGVGGLSEGAGQQGRTGRRRLHDRDVREGSEEQSLQDLEPDVLGQLLSAPGAGGGGTETAWRRHPGSRGAHRRGQNRADRGGRPAGESGGTEIPPRLLRVPAAPVGTGRGGHVPGTLLVVRLGDRFGHPEVLRQRALGPDRQSGRG